MKKVIYAGVRKATDGFQIDYIYNYPEDLIEIVEPQLYTSIHNNNIYHFGYRFTDNSNSTDRTEFIHAVKQIGDHPLEDYELDQFIKRPLKYLDKEINLYDIDCMVYPLSNRSPLVSKIVRCINDMTSHEMRRCSFELVKKAPTQIDFDFSAFERDYASNQDYQSMLKYANEILLPELRSLDYFSIAQNVRSRYRSYVTGFIDFDTEEDVKRFSRLQGNNILILDDMDTTGSTLHEILRKLGRINNKCNIYVYTLIGK